MNERNSENATVSYIVRDAIKFICKLLYQGVKNISEEVIDA